jgi:hypothetical protein
MRSSTPERSRRSSSSGSGSSRMLTTMSSKGSPEATWPSGEAISQSGAAA